MWFANLRDPDVQETHRSAEFLLSRRVTKKSSATELLGSLENQSHFPSSTAPSNKNGTGNAYAHTYLRCVQGSL